MRAQQASRSPRDRSDLSEFESEAADAVYDLKIDRDRDTAQPETPLVMLPLHGSADPYVARYDAYPEDRKDRIRTAIGITLLAIAGLGLGFWGYWLFRTSADPDASPAIAQQSQPAPAPEPAAVLPEATTNPTPTARAPQGPARQAASPATATPAPDASKTAAPVVPPSAPSAVSPDRAQAPQRQSPPVASVPPASSVGTPAAAAPRSEKPTSPPPTQQTAVSAASTGGLFAITRPIGAQVFLDDKPVGTTPLFLSNVPHGQHAIRLELPGFKPYASSIDVKPNERFRVAAQLEQ